MDYNVMIESEDTDVYFEQWKDYRDGLTDFIINSVESFYTKAYLRKTGKKRLVREYGMKEIVDELNYKPTLAIWGAGGCNDVDVIRLSSFFKLILIDHNIEKITSAKKRFNLLDEDCICVDLKFWDFSHAEYLMIDAMIKDNCEKRDLENYIRDIIFKMPEYNYSEMPHFDFSVAAGLVSQLNSRFAALLHINRYKYDMTEFLYDINEIAVERFLNVITNMTRNIFIMGYEHKVLGETGVIAGNDIMSEMIEDMVYNDTVRLFMCQQLLWNFTSEKKYVMQVDSYEL